MKKLKCKVFSSYPTPSRVSVALLLALKTFCVKSRSLGSLYDGLKLKEKVTAILLKNTGQIND